MSNTATTSRQATGNAFDETKNPNIVYILADDLGYGDVGCYNDESRIPTPSIDQLAAKGRRFTDAHAPSAVCTPSRYALLTGRHCWRTSFEEWVLRPFDPPLIDADRLTVAHLLGEHGYQTACIGKWHLGWEWPGGDGRPVNEDLPIGEKAYEERKAIADEIDFTGTVSGGPVDRGFDYYFGDGVQVHPPYTWIENDEIVDQPTELAPEELHGGWDGFPMAPGWDLETIMPTVTNRSVEYVEHDADEPFFLFCSLTAPHTPLLPTEQFQGRSDAGTYGDFVCQLDDAVGRILDALERRGIADDTVVIVTSDNGPENIAYDRIRDHDHYSMGGFRGVKRDTWEGGHRVPFVARWPSEIPAGTVTSETVCLTDLLATVASLLDADLPADAGEDSYDILPALCGDPPAEPVRDATVYHAGNGCDGEVAIRRGKWVLIESADPDNNGEPEWFREERRYTDHDQPGELYDLRTDPAQRHNQYADRPQLAEELEELLAAYRDGDR